MSTVTKDIEISEGIYWVGVHDRDNGLNCNPYLLVDKDEAVLFDPGSVLDFTYVYEKVNRLVPLEKIKYVVLHHQDPDLCSSVPLLESKGANFKVVTHWRTQTLVRYYGIKSEYYLVNENNYSLTLKSGRKIDFVQTPYLHFPGSIVSYDRNSKTLFSSDLFGAFSNNWSLYAGDDYVEKMKTFHEHYMPSNEILRSVMEMLLSMDINLIAPQHGSIINKEIDKYIKALRDLECGIFINPVKKKIKESGGYTAICSIVLKRYAYIYGSKEVIDALNGLDIEIDNILLEITDYNYSGRELWQRIFDNIYIRKGVKWLVIIEPLVEKLSKEYELPIPNVFASRLKKAEEQTVLLNDEVTKLKEINERLTNNIRETQEKMIICPVTGLYNELFFHEYLKAEVSALKTKNEENMCLIIISIDEIAKIKFSYGDSEVNDVMKGIVYILNDIKEDNHLLFRLQGEFFACYVPNASKEKASILAESLRNEIKNSDKFVENITVSIGLTSLDEFNQDTELAERMYRVTMMRVGLAKSRGMNLVCNDSSVEDYQDKLGKILIVDADIVSQDVLKTFLENLQYEVITAGDGEEALALVMKELPDIVVSEIMLPKMDGFILCEKMSLYSATKNIPFIITSHLKNENGVQRAISLGIEHYFKKPYMLSELLGIIRKKVKGEAFI